MINPELIAPFYDYLDKTNIDKSWEEMGLIANAPPEAVAAYEEYKRLIREINKSEYSDTLY